MEKYYQLLNTSRNLVGKCLDNHPEPKKEKDALLLYAITKSNKTLSAIILLCRNGMGEDAAMLCRTLMDLNLKIEYIFKDETDERAKMYFDYDWIQRATMLKYAKTSSEAEKFNDPENIKIINEVEKKASLAKSKYKYKSSGLDKNLYEIVQELNRTSLYETVYRIQCSLSHSSPRSMNDYFKIKGDQLTFDAGPSDNFVRETIVASFNFYYGLIVQYNTYFKKGIDKELEQLEEEFVTLVKSNI